MKKILTYIFLTLIIINMLPSCRKDSFCYKCTLHLAGGDQIVDTCNTGGLMLFYDSAGKLIPSDCKEK